MSFFRSRRYLLSRLEPIGISSKVHFGVDNNLAAKQRAKAVELGPNSVKKIWRTDHPEPVKPRIDIPEHFPIG